MIYVTDRTMYLFLRDKSDNWSIHEFYLPHQHYLQTCVLYYTFDQLVKKRAFRRWEFERFRFIVQSPGNRKN